MRRYVIIGTGVAGISAAEVIRSQDTSGEILLIGDEPYGYYSRPGLAYFLTNEIPQQLLFPYSKKDFTNLNIQSLRARVIKIYPNDQLIETHSGDKIHYDQLLIAVGAAAAVPKIPGIDLTGVVKLDNLKDARSIIKLTGKARKAVVVGGGITALELVEGFRARGVKTHYLLRRDRFWGSVLDETESKIVEQRLIGEGVKIHYHTEVEKILGKRGRVSGVSIGDGKIIKCRLVGVAIGIKPRTRLAENAGIQTDRGILVNEFLQTNFPNIYAAGDITQVFDPFTGKTIIDSLWVPARLQGQTAGLNMTGQNVPYIKGVAFNVTRLAGLTTTIIGSVGRGADEDLVSIVRGDSETWRRIPDALVRQSKDKDSRLRLMLGENTILGAVMMGDQTLYQYLQPIISKQIDISPIREQLLQPNLPIGNIIIGFCSKRNLQLAV
ncbi:MAG: NAD(P)/FAD-dependent oxidoreductase [Chloroflexi bacterium]|nr:NAD(P)/FAD-dependent oxidoreductase [Chloroflexota bacterium]